MSVSQGFARCMNLHEFHEHSSTSHSILTSLGWGSYVVGYFSEEAAVEDKC